MTEQVLAPARRRENWRRDAIAAALFGLIPVLGILLWNWSPLALLLLFGFENVVIGVRQVAMTLLVARARPTETLGAVGQAMFFVIHYGGFCAGHIFFSVLLVYVMGPGAPPPDADGGYPVELSVAFGNALQTTGAAWLGIVGVLAFQALQMLEFVRAREAQTVSLNRLMGEPYVRIMVLHIVIIVGAGLVLNSGLPPKVFVALALYKLAVDVGEVLWRAHRKPKAKTAAALPPPERGVVFDVTKQTQGMVFVYVGAALLVIGALAAAITFLQITIGGDFASAATWAVLATLFGGFAIFSIVSTHRKLVRSLTDGSGQIVEGRVQYFTPRHKDSKLHETFSVNGVRFVYIDEAITGGFNKTAYRGGPIREDLSVRIHYLPTPDWQPAGNVITRLEVLS